MPSNLFIGYDLLEEWAEVADPARPVYLMHYAVPERDGVRSLVPHQWLTVSQPDEAHHVHYCRFEVAEPELVYARSVHAAAHTEEEARTQHETRRAAGRQARDLVAAWLVEQGFTVRAGLVAVPRELMLLSGGADFLAWDAATHRYQRRAPTVGDAT